MENKRVELVEVNESIPLAISEKQGDGFRYATFLVSEGDTMNRNRRIYPTSVWQREATDIGRNNVTGQSGHPLWSTDLLDQFLLFTEGNVVDNKFYATAKVIPTPEGEKFATIADAGVRVAVSTRGYGSTKKEEWTDPVTGVVYTDANVVQSDYSLRGIDVIFPGEQSVDGAKMIRFEATGKVDMDELKERVELLEKELEERDETITKYKEGAEAHAGVLGEKSEEISKLEEQLAEVQQENEGWAEEIKGLEADVVGLEERVTELEGERGALLERISSLAHLMDRVKGEKFAMPLFVKLFDSKTVPDVDKSWDEALAEIEKDLSGDLPDITPKGVVEKKPGDDLEESDSKPWEQKDNITHLRSAGLG